MNVTATKDIKINPLIFSALKNLDIETFEDDLAREMQRKKYLNEREKTNNKKILDESEEIKEWRKKIQLAKLNKERSKQIQEVQMRKLNDLVKDAEADEEVLLKLDHDMIKEQQNEGKQRLVNIFNKHVIQQQMKDKEKRKDDAKYEYDRDRKQIDDIMRKIAEEDMHAIQTEKAKKAQAKAYMEMSCTEKAERLRKQKEDEEREKEREREYFRNLEHRANELKAKKAEEKKEKDRIFDKLCEEKKKKEAEKEYWESVRNELHVEELDKKNRIKELEEQAKKIRQKEQMLASAIEHAQEKELRKQKEREEENEFKKKLLEQFKEDERLEQFNIIKRKQKELDYKCEIERQWKLKLDQYKKQKEYELMLLKTQQEEERRKREFIEIEKMKLIRDNQDILKTYLSKEYYKATNGFNN